MSNVSHAQLELQEQQSLQLQLHILLDHLRLEDVDVFGGPDLLEQLQVDGLPREAGGLLAGAQKLLVGDSDVLQERVDERVHQILVFDVRLQILGWNCCFFVRAAAQIVFAVGQFLVRAENYTNNKQMENLILRKCAMKRYFTGNGVQHTK